MKQQDRDMSSIPPLEWAAFIDRGAVSEFRCQQIALKIKKQETLTKQELSIYQHAAEKIEYILKQK
jgi:hypothetical protein